MPVNAYYLQYYPQKLTVLYSGVRRVSTSISLVLTCKHAINALNVNQPIRKRLPTIAVCLLK